MTAKTSNKESFLPFPAGRGRGMGIETGKKYIQSGCPLFLDSRFY
jgi:hypothetical protein